MLAIKKLTAACVEYRFAADLVAYQGSAGTWRGQGARLLRLPWTVTRSYMQNLLEGYAPERSCKLVQNAGQADRHSGVEIVLTATKPVSIAAGIARADLQRIYVDAHDAAVDATIQHLEETAAFSRLGKGGRQLEKVGLVIAEFTDWSSRADDCNLHTHLYVMNVGVTAAGRSNAIISKKLFQAKMAAGAIYRAELARQLRLRLGLKLDKEKIGFSIPGISKQVCDHFSKRRKAIVGALRDHGAASARAAAVAALATRPDKSHLGLNDLQAQWRQEAAILGLTPEMVVALSHQSPLKPISESHKQKTVAVAIAKLTGTDSHFSERDLTRLVAETVCIEGWSAKEIRTSVQKALSDPVQVVRLETSQREPRFTTPAILAEERKILAEAEVLHGRNTHRVAPKIVERALTRETRLNEEQRLAIRNLIHGGDLALLSGHAGTGKSTVLRMAQECWQGYYRVIGLTVAGKAAEGLEASSGIKSTTIYRALRDLDASLKDNVKHHVKQLTRAARRKKTYALDRLKLDARTILVIDEASMVSTEDMAKIVKHVAAAQAKLVLVGDERQLQSIQRGGVFQGLLNRHLSSSLSEIVRQEEQWARKAVKAFAAGEAEEALKAYTDRGLVHVGKNREEAIKAIAAEWRASAGTKPESYLVLAPTTEDVRRLNQQIQAGRTDIGYLSLTVDGQKFHARDRILFTENSPMLGVTNGSLGTIKAVHVTSRTLDVLLDNGKTTRVPLKHYQKIALGYTISVHRAQGVTVDNALILMSGSMLDREMAYVQASRTRKSTKLFTDRFEAGPKLSELTKQIKVSRQKTLATDAGVAVNHPSIRPKHQP